MKASSPLGVIALVPDEWDGIVTVRHHVLRRLARHFPVIWVEPAKSWREYLLPTGSRFLTPDRWSEPVNGMSVLRTGWRHPSFYRLPWLAAASLRSRLSLARRKLLKDGAKRIALYIWRDEFADALDLIKHDFSCYHIDDEYSFSEREQPTSWRELRLLERVDQVIVHSLALLEKKGHVNPRTELIPNGVNFLHFSRPHPEPSDIAPIARPRIGYAGVIKKQINLGLLIRLAKIRPLYSFVLVGPVVNISGKEHQVAELKRLENVFFLGPKPADVLAEYIQHFDVCLMCYEVNDYTQYIYPLKLLEYLAAGVPTVSSPIKIVQAFAEAVTIANTDAEWLYAIEQSLRDEARTELAAELRRDFARLNDWDLLVDRIADLFRSGLCQCRGGCVPSGALKVYQSNSTTTG